MISKKNLNDIWQTAFKMSQRMVSDESGQVQNLIVMIVAIVVGAILTGALGGMALDQVVAAKNSSWTMSLQNTFAAVPILYAVAFLLVPIVVILKYVG